MLQLHLSQDQNLANIAGQLFKLQANLIAKEKHLGQMICDREQVNESDTLFWCVVR